MHRSSVPDSNINFFHLPSQTNATHIVPGCFKIFNFLGQYKIHNHAPDFPIAFTVVAHREFLRLFRLLWLIYRPQNSYCIHIDKRSTPEFRLAIENLLSCFAPNIHLIATEQNVDVPGGDVFEPQLVCAKSLLYRKAGWLLLVSCVGLALPLRICREMEAALKDSIIWTKNTLAFGVDIYLQVR